MRIVQSYWACNQQDLLFNQPAWLAPEYNLMAWALSCLQLKRYYNEVVLYADTTTANILIDTLKLPYTSVISNLDKLNNYHKELWALPKIYVYAQQEKPFLHIDGDVFIWKAFEDKLIKSSLIAQNLESATKYYEGIMVELQKNLTYFPKEIIQERDQNNQILAYNAGIFGGCDLHFFKNYAKKAFEFVDNNINSLSKIKVTNFNIFFEQYLFYCIAKQQKKHVSVLINDIIGDNEYKGFGDFTEVPHNKQYLHTLGTYKKSENVCLQLANRLRQDYPEYYYRIIELYKNNKYNLKKDYYYFLDNVKQQTLLDRQILLKEKYKKDLLPAKSYKRNLFPPIKPRVIHNLPPHIQLDYDNYFENIRAIQKKKFVKISMDYLYARDINLTQYFEYLFANITKIFNKQLIADDKFVIIKSSYNWSELDNINFNLREITRKPSDIYTALIPECDITCFTTKNIDLLDIEILNLLKKPTSVGRLLNQCKKLFPADDGDDTEEILQKLIFGRIKKGLHYKTIRAILKD